MTRHWFLIVFVVLVITVAPLASLQFLVTVFAVLRLVYIEVHLIAEDLCHLFERFACMSATPVTIVLAYGRGKIYAPLVSGKKSRMTTKSTALRQMNTM